MVPALFSESGKSFKRSHRTRAACSLRVELLEDRCLLSASFKALAYLGDPAPGARNLTHTFDWEPGAINDRGQIAFGSDLSPIKGDATGAKNIGEGVFLQQPSGQRLALARVGDTAPDGATYGFYFAGEIRLNEKGDGAFVFGRDPEPDPFITGVNAGLYRFTSSGSVTPALLPGAAAPGGGTFRGYVFRPTINDSGTIAFVGIVPTTIGPGAALGLGQGDFLLDRHGHVSTIVRPGDPAPGGNTFDWAQNPYINNEGDVAFGAHITKDPFIQFGATFPSTLTQIFTAESVYFRDKETGAIRAIATQGGPAPGGGKFTYAFGPVLNDNGDIVFGGALPANPPGTGLNPANNDNNIGVFMHHDGHNIALVRPGDPMPGGGHVRTAGFFTVDLGLNNQGVVGFCATLDTVDPVNGDGFNDTGLYTWSHGKVSLVARTGTVIPGVGTIQALMSPGEEGATSPFGGGEAINNRGQMVFQATLTDGRGVLLLATPSGDDDRGTGTPPDSVAPRRTTPAAVLPLVQTAISNRQGDSGVVEVRTASQTANAPPLLGQGSAVAPPPHTATLPAPASSVATNASPHRAVDQLFAAFAERFWDDPLVQSGAKASGG